jgi:malonyl-CoA O-methyltransferase
VDLSPQMLERAGTELGALHSGATIALVQGSLAALPVPDARADLTVCGLVVGHLDDLEQSLAELRRVTRPGGTLLCSDVHPIGHALGWRRDFKSGGLSYAVRHTRHLYSHWYAACAGLGLRIEQVLEPMLDPADVPVGAHFDRMALEVPVALVFQLRRAP